jgi:hypothetical protein
VTGEHSQHVRAFAQRLLGASPDELAAIDAQHDANGYAASRARAAGAHFNDFGAVSPGAPDDERALGLFGEVL